MVMEKSRSRGEDTSVEYNRAAEQAFLQLGRLLAEIDRIAGQHLIEKSLQEKTEIATSDSQNEQSSQNSERQTKLVGKMKTHSSITVEESVK